jgi:hypothetical protein
MQKCASTARRVRVRGLGRVRIAPLPLEIGAGSALTLIAPQSA